MIRLNNGDEMKIWSNLTGFSHFGHNRVGIIFAGTLLQEKYLAPMLAEKRKIQGRPDRSEYEQV
ncbi:MAG: hypothetical protein COA47_10980 [Robiginitomaculum sp.]|nr:MAG: hypothetical protein COA47_10980 [Robiginitomaculum sp.]